MISLPLCVIAVGTCIMLPTVIGAECRAEHCMNCKPGYCIECVYGYHGIACNKQCQNCWHGGCEQLTGRCIQCKPGYYTELCDIPCPQHCRMSADGKKYCNRTNGHCLEGCADGYWGSQCDKRCGRHCLKSICEQKNEECLIGCHLGWFGPLCTKRYHCVGNSIPLKGKCFDGCQDTWWGNMCDLKCSKHCDNFQCTQEGMCLHQCKDGWYGIKCNNICSANCPERQCSFTVGECTKNCKTGFTGRMCNISCNNCLDGACTYNILTQSVQCLEGCKEGWWSTDCRKRCSMTCQDGRCGIDGRCLVCPDGFHGNGCMSRCQSDCLRCDMSGYCMEEVSLSGAAGLNPIRLFNVITFTVVFLRITEVYLSRFFNCPDLFM